MSNFFLAPAPAITSTIYLKEDLKRIIKLCMDLFFQVYSSY